MKRLYRLIFLFSAGAILSCIFKSNVDAAEATLIEQDITNLRDSFNTNLGEEVYAGVSLTENELNDPNIMGLVTKHFNAVTLGNELKPDAMFGYSNHKCPELIAYDFNGEEYIAPKMDYSRAEHMLDYFVKWNEENPDRIIKVRGHVLVWHSQTPEWFFHENYDKNEPYLTPSEMDKRQEWYIKEVLEHFTGKYEGLFYGWDVVNEAISDATGTYRTDAENSADSLTDDTHGSKSSWWKVYGSNQYIINAFKYANKYAPSYVELYYNDYNECNPLKSNGIINLLEDVKAAEGTRIDGMGMQGHYDMTQPTGGQVKVAAKRYADVVGNVSLTELDLKSSDSYDGSDEEKEKEYRRQYMKYKEIYQGLSELIEEGVTIRTVTVWGVIDRNSWLQFQNNVGGGANGKHKQCPLLFDDNYKAKPLFYALCNEEIPVVAKEETTDSDENEFDISTEENNSVESEEANIDESKLEEIADESERQSTEVTNSKVADENENNSNRYSIIAIIVLLVTSVGLLAIGRKRANDDKKE